VLARRLVAFLPPLWLFLCRRLWPVLFAVIASRLPPLTFLLAAWIVPARLRKALRVVAVKIRRLAFISISFPFETLFYGIFGNYFIRKSIVTGYLPSDVKSAEPGGYSSGILRVTLAPASGESI